MRKFILCLLAVLTTFAVNAQKVQDSLVAERLSKMALSALYNEFRLPQEKVYVQTDNSGYVENETLWFKVNVVRASLLKPTTLSRVVYVELLNAAGELMQRKVLRVEKGEAWGEFKLEPPILTGYYELRAYTREMLNWGRDVCFSRVFPIFAKPEQPDTYTDLSIARIKHEENLPLGHARPFLFKSNDGININFFTEGGHRLQGQSARIAYKLTNDRGVPLNGVVTLKNDKGEDIDETASMHEGMGLLSVPADCGRGKVEVSVDGDSKTFSLPQAETQGYGMIVDNLSDTSQVRILVQKAQTTPSQLLGLHIGCRGLTCKFDTLKVGAAPVEMIVPNSYLRAGINQITLFDSAGTVLCERLVFKHPADSAQLKLSVSQNSALYSSLQPIALEMGLTDSKGKPVAADFALSVRDNEGELTDGPHHSIESNLLLASDLRGYINKPDFYFEANDMRHNQALDLLLMVQGWSRYNFRQMAEIDTLRATQPIEEGITLDGYVLRRWRDKPLADVDLGLLLYNQNGASMKSQALTNEAGYFAFKSDSIYDDWQGQFATMVNDEMKQSRITLNRGFSPAPRAYTEQEQTLKAPSLLRPDWADKIETFQWRDTLPQQHIIHLGEATVKAKGKKSYIYYEKEADALQFASVYYNMDQEVEKLQDEGDEIPLLYAWLKERNKDFDYTRSVPDAGADSLMASMDAREPKYTCTYRERPVMFFINNDPRDMRIGHDIYCDELKSIVIMQNSTNWMRFVRGEQIDGLTKSSQNITGIFLFTRPNGSLYRNKRGIRTITIHGYQTPDAYYSPNYRQTDTPNPNDFRRTLYWNPCVKTNVAGKASAVFFSNARGMQQLRISAEGLAADGKFINYQR